MSVAAQFLYVALGGMMGAVLRYGAYVASGHLLADVERIWVTAGVNIVGSFFLGLLFGISQHWSLDERLALLLMIGLIGSFTTFATFAIEAVELLSSGHSLLVAAYVIVSNVLSFAAAFAGIAIVRSLAT